MKFLQKMILLTLFYCTLFLAAEVQSIFSYPQNVQGRRIAAYFAAFGEGSEAAMENFLNENLSSEALGRDPVAPRLARFRAFKKQAGTLSPVTLLRQEGDRTSLLARDGRGQWLEYTFVFEKGGQERLSAILAAPIAPENVADLSGPPMGRTELLARVNVLLDEQAKADLFSGVVLLAQDGQVQLHEARGLASREYDAANRLDTRFNLGSINKLFTRVAIGQLVERKKLSLDDPIKKFLPDYPNREAAAKVTVRQLLDMTSGIGDFFGDTYDRTPKNRLRSLSDYLPLFAGEPLLFEPGSNRRYSNGGYIVLGLIIEKASGQDYSEFVRDHICQPAGMTATGHLDADIPAANVASGYTRLWDDGDHVAEPRRNNLYTRPARGSSAGGGYSTAGDLLKFALALKAGKLLGPLAGEWFSGPQAYAGGAPGINAELDIEPVPGWTVVVMGNYDPPAANNLAQKIVILLKRMR